MYIRGMGGSGRNPYKIRVFRVFWGSKNHLKNSQKNWCVLGCFWVYLLIEFVCFSHPVSVCANRLLCILLNRVFVCIKYV